MKSSSMVATAFLLAASVLMLGWSICVLADALYIKPGGCSILEMLAAGLALLLLLLVAATIIAQIMVSTITAIVRRALSSWRSGGSGS